MKEKILVNGMVWGQKEPLVSPIDYDDFIKEMLEAMGQDKASFQVETDFGKMEEGGSKKSLGTIFHVPDPNNPLEVKWALLLPAKSPETEAIAAALKPLVDHRQGQVWFSPKPPAATEPLTWITDHYLQLDDDQKPYYILLAGDPEAIPFRFQYNLDVAAAVGRVFFKNLDDYAQYAKKVVDFETGKDAFVANRAVFFATEHPWQDDVTHISRRYMTNPLVDMVTKMGVQVSYFAGDEATLTNLMSNFGDASTEKRRP